MCYSKKEYNDEPVFYCKNCLSLSIKEISNAGLYVCLECGTPKQEEAHIDEYQKLYIERYGKPFLSTEASEELAE